MKCTLLAILLFLSVSINASESRDNNTESGKNRTSGPVEQSLYPLQTAALNTRNILYPVQKPSLFTSVNTITLSNNTSINKRNNKTAPRKRVRHEHKLQLIFSGICLGTALTAIIFNGVAKSQQKKEEKLYNTYKTAGAGSDFDKLWNDVEDARDKTDAYLMVRNASGITTGAIGIALFFSFSLETK